MVDFRKTLPVLQEEWEDCTKCFLGERRAAMRGSFVFGEGYNRGILFLGEGPGREEEREGRPFVGPGGVLLRAVLEKYNFDNCFFTDIVACRSCEPMLDADGKQVMGKSWKGKPPEPEFRDKLPIPTEIEACNPRLFETIYLADPIVIVPLGPVAAQALLGRPVQMGERGKPAVLRLPGATYRAELTEKKNQWLRRTGEGMRQPVSQNLVEYLVLPTYPTYFVLRKEGDSGKGSPMHLFVSDIKLAIALFNRYQNDALGVPMTAQEVQTSSDEAEEFAKGYIYENQD